MIGSLCNDEVFLRQMQNENEKITDLVQLTTELATEPVIISSVCYFSLQLLQQSQRMLSRGIDMLAKEPSNETYLASLKTHCNFIKKVVD